MTMHSVRYGNTTIEYELIYSNRKTLAIHVHPDLRVTVVAPEGSDLSRVQEKVHKRAPWILRQKREFSRYLPHLPPREYVSGETHRYLGRQYRLKVVPSQTSYEGVKMQRGRIFVTLPDPTDTGQVKQLLDAWYRKHAERVFRERLDELFPRFARFGLERPQLSLRVMQTRWGSCTANGRILLNPKLIQVPKPCIDYVIVHELCHLKEHHHGPEFYALLSRVMPDWEARKRRLDEFEFG